MTDVMWNIFKIRNTIITEPGKNMKEAKDGDVLNTGFETSFHFLHPLRPILTIKIQKKELYKNGATPDTRNSSTHLGEQNSSGLFSSVMYGVPIIRLAQLLHCFGFIFDLTVRTDRYI